MKACKPNEQDPYSLLGYAIEHAQAVESMLRFVTTFVFQEKDALTLESLLSIQKADRKKTLGQFIKKLSARTTLHQNFEGNLSLYLDMRNALVHDHKRIEGWDLYTDDGVEKAKQYIWDFLRLGNHILELFAAVVEDWSIQIGLETKSHSIDPYISKLHEKYKPFLFSIFGGSDQ